jgi:glycerophosphoryl diester phosphodiesterase
VEGAVFDPPEEPTVQELTGANSGPDPERDLAARYAPVLLFDAQEPFLPLVVGYTVYRQSGPSLSAHRYISLGREHERHADTVIEYAIWWDWDIGHLYELEHLWVFLDGNGEVIHAEGSRHGGYRKLLVDGAPPMTGQRLTVYSESGKHGFSPTQGWLEKLAPVTRKLCTRHAGLEGVLITWLFRGIIRAKTPESDQLVHTHLERYAFEPTLDFARRYPIPEGLLVRWPALYSWIPRRVGWWVAELKRTIPAHQRRFYRIALRGASAHAPENTRAAIEKAAEQGADVVKLDVQPSADGVPIIYHGLDLSRTTNGSGPVSSHTLAQLKQLDAGQGQAILTLDEAIACCREQHLGLYLELQSEAIIDDVVGALRRAHIHDRAAVAAFEPGWLARVKGLDRRIRTAILLRSPHIDAVGLARAVGADYIHPAWEAEPADMHRLLAAGWLRDIRAAGLGIICDHGRCLCDLPALRLHGVNGICTPDPSLLMPRVG